MPPKKKRPEPEVTTRKSEPEAKSAAVLRAIEAGNYGSQAQTVVRDAPGAAVGRLRHSLYVAGCERAGDALVLTS